MIRWINYNFVFHWSYHWSFGSISIPIINYILWYIESTIISFSIILIIGSVQINIFLYLIICKLAWSCVAVWYRNGCLNGLMIRKYRDWEGLILETGEEDRSEAYRSLFLSGDMSAFHAFGVSTSPKLSLLVGVWKVGEQQRNLQLQPPEWLHARRENHLSFCM